MWKKLQFWKKNQETTVQTATDGAELSTEDQSAFADFVEEVPARTKIKVVAALMMVSFASYVAYWVQEPMEFKADVLNGTEQSAPATPGDSGTIQYPAATQSEANAPSQQESKPVAQADQATNEVSIVDFSYDPATLTVEKGTTVTWTNKDTVPHTVTSDTFTSASLNPGQTYSFTFDTEGTFDYHCAFHPNMKGKVVVTAAKNPPAPAPAPATTSATSVTSAVDAAASTTSAAMEMHASAPTTSAAPAAPVAPANTAPVALNPVPAPVQVYAHSASGAQILGEHPAAPEYGSMQTTTSTGQIASSGPEDILYAAVFGAVLFFNRKKLLKVRA